MKPGLTVQTERLLLRRPLRSDAAAVFERYASDPDVTRYLSWPRHRSVTDTLSFLAYSDSEWERWPVGPMLIESRTDGCLLGGTGLTFETAHQASTGYVLAKDAWGRGCATEALAAMRDLAPQVGLRSLYALCHAEHTPSRRVLEKCGFVRDETFRESREFPNLEPGRLYEIVRYAIEF